MADIDAAIGALAQRFAQDLIRALVSARIDELVRVATEGAGRLPAPKRQPTHTAAKADAKPPGGTGKPRTGRTPAKRGRRSSEEIGGLVERVASFVREGAADTPEGVAISEIAKALKVEVGVLTRPMALALQQRLVKKKGDKRMTRYFPGPRAE